MQDPRPPRRRRALRFAISSALLAPVAFSAGCTEEPEISVNPGPTDDGSTPDGAEPDAADPDQPRMLVNPGPEERERMQEAQRQHEAEEAAASADEEAAPDK